MTPRIQWIPVKQLPEENLLPCIMLGERYVMIEGFFIRSVYEDCKLKPGFYQPSGGYLYACPWVKFYIPRPTCP